MELIAMLAVGAVVLFCKLTSKDDRERWGWNIVAFLVVSGFIGLVVSVMKSGALPE